MPVSSKLFASLLLMAVAELVILGKYVGKIRDTSKKNHEGWRNACNLVIFRRQGGRFLLIISCSISKSSKGPLSRSSTNLGHSSLK
jgi:hypothetical protein